MVAAKTPATSRDCVTLSSSGRCRGTCRAYLGHGQTEGVRTNAVVCPLISLTTCDSSNRQRKQVNVEIRKVQEETRGVQ